MKLVAIHRYPRYVRGLWRLIATKVRYRQIRRIGVNVPESAAFIGMPIISMKPGSKIAIGENCVICSDSKFTELGVNHPVVMRTLRSEAMIMIGKDTGISGGAICAAVSVTIGDECLIGANVTITDTDFHPMNPAGRRYNQNPQEISAEPVEIGDNVFIGTGALILKGVKIGANSVIGAGSVVTGDVPPDSIVAGSPARFIRKI